MDAQERVWPYLTIVFCLLILSLVAPHYWQWRHRGGKVDWRALVANESPENQYAPDAPVPSHGAWDGDGQSNGVSLGTQLTVPSIQANASRFDSATSDLPVELRLNAPLNRLDQRGLAVPRPATTHLAGRTAQPTPATANAAARADKNLKQAQAPLPLSATNASPNVTANADSPWDFSGEGVVVEFGSLVGNQVGLRSPTATSWDVMPPDSGLDLSPRLPERVAILLSRGPRRSQSIDQSLWPRPTQLIQQLQAVRGDQASENWAAEVIASLQHLHYVRSLDSPAARDALAELSQLGRDAERLAPRVRDEGTQRQLQEVASTLNRRMVVWQQVHRTAGAPRTFRQVSYRRATDVRPAITAAIDSIPGTKAPPAWRHYLRLDDIEFALAQGPLSPWQQSELARQTLRQMNSPRLNRRQKQFLARDEFVALADQLKTWATEPVDLTEVLHAVEQFEQSNDASNASQVARLFDRYRWSTQPASARLATSIDNSYRNANLRVAITGTLLNEMIDQPEDSSAQVAEQILDAWVEGERHTTSTAAIRLIPDEDQWRLGFETTGSTYSDTTSYAGRATFQSEGWGEFSARKLIVIEKDRVRLWKADATASHQSQVYAVNTSLSGLPLISQIARNRALGEFQSQQWAAQQEIEARMRYRVQERVDTEVQQPIYEARKAFKERFFEPLDQLGIQPTTVNLQTTDARIVGHYRLADYDELAATTPRPWAPKQCRVSAQVHESLLNNLIAGLRLDGRTLTGTQLRNEYRRAMGREPVEAEVEESDEVTYVFADQDSVRIRLEDGQLQLSARFREVRHDGYTWKDVEASTTYVADTTSQLAALTRDGSTKIRGRQLGIRDQVRLRGIFGASFNRFEQFNLIPEELAKDAMPEHLVLMQYVIVDGWIGLAWGKRDQMERVAELKPHWLSR